MNSYQRLHRNILRLISSNKLRSPGSNIYDGLYSWIETKKEKNPAGSIVSLIECCFFFCSAYSLFGTSTPEVTENMYCY